MGFETPPSEQKPEEATRAAPNAAPKEELAAADATKSPETKRPALEAEFPALAKMKPHDDEPRAEAAADEYANTVAALGPQVIAKAEAARNALVAKMQARG